MQLLRPLVLPLLFYALIQQVLLQKQPIRPV